ncbi:MAG TPA: flagellar filament capping protein FliD [Acidobacteriaceae bacterium]|jgi:flagellar hook-associated protein 2
MSSVSSVNSLLSSTSTGSSAVSVSSILAAAAGVSTPGIDVTAAVSAALYADRAQERIWQGEQTTLSSQTTALTSIQTATQTLATDFSNLNSLTGPLSARTVTSSNPYAASATAASGTAAGTHSIAVNSLATTASWYSDLASSPTATLPSASFTLTTASGSTATINIGTGGVNTLNDVASAINGQNLGVTASVISDATGSRLAIVAPTSGAASDFTVTSAPYSGTSWSSPSLSSGQTLGADSITLTTNGTPTTLTVTSGETLSQLASDINGRSLGVTASVVSDSNGSHLSIASDDGTTPFSISEPAFGFSQAAAGANASITVDGVPVSSASNTVTGAVAGVTIYLLGTTTATSPANLTVASDTTQISTAINKFVSDYNTAIGLVSSQFSFNAGTGTQGVLGADPTIRSLQQTMLNALNYVSTPASGTTTVSTLGSLGISANLDGTLSVDSTTLSNALANNPMDVSNFFLGANSSLNGFASQVSAALNTFVQPGSGAFSVDLQSMNNTNTDLSKQISDFESIYIANQQTLLTAMYSQAEIALQQLPTQMAQIQAELGNNQKSS